MPLVEFGRLERYGINERNSTTAPPGLVLGKCNDPAAEPGKAARQNKKFPVEVRPEQATQRQSKQQRAVWRGSPSSMRLPFRPDALQPRRWQTDKLSLFRALRKEHRAEINGLLPSCENQENFAHHPSRRLPQE